MAWEDLCCPRDEGGLGVRKLRDSSKVFALSLIWRIFFKLIITLGILDSALSFETKLLLGFKGGWEGIVDLEEAVKVETHSSSVY